LGLRFSQLRADINKVCLVFVHMKIQQKEGKEKRPVRIDDQDVRKARSMQIARRSAVLSLTCGLAGTKPPPAVCPRLLCRACSTRATFFSLFPERLSSLLAVDIICLLSRHNDSKNFSVADWFCPLREECDLRESFQPFWV